MWRSGRTGRGLGEEAAVHEERVRIDRQSSLDELFPPSFLAGLADPVPDEEQSEAAAELSERTALCDALEWLRSILIETIADWGLQKTTSGYCNTLHLQTVCVLLLSSEPAGDKSCKGYNAD